ncbi:MAG TPA: DUF423 domain-containing protein [Chthonomonadaceae bacterium]|nr:DUF423 domain-containing protein [Chthonomonadaceae bacterium]
MREQNQHEAARTLWMLGGIAGFLAVALGAFGAHALRSRLSTEMLDIFKTGVQYQALHALALLLVALLAERRAGNTLLPWVGWLFTTGIVLFSGSLYGLAITGVRILGAITPLGGICFLAGWALLIASAKRA